MSATLRSKRSRADHHRALVVAQRLKRADDASAGTARAAFLDYWGREGSHHFRQEEESEERELFPLIEQVMPNADVTELASKLGS